MGSVSVSFVLSRLVPLVLALGLAGCGVKGALEPPPQSGIEPNAPAAHAATVPVTPGTLAAPHTAARSNLASTTAGATSQAVVNAPAAQRRSVLDWLID
jgi:predicted small lipoprotein YifL